MKPVLIFPDGALDMRYTSGDWKEGGEPMAVEYWLCWIVGELEEELLSDSMRFFLEGEPVCVLANLIGEARGAGCSILAEDC